MVVIWRPNEHDLQTKSMKKILSQGLIAVLLFFGMWFTLLQIDWMSLFKVDKIADKTEEQLGKLFIENIQKTELVNNSPFVVSAIDSIVTKICLSNNIDRASIHVYVHQNDEINAYVLPDGHLVIYSGLILNSENEEELSGVICHELAHIQLNHVMQKLIKEVGLSVLISMTTGGNGAELIQETAKMLSSSAFDRSLEKEADIKAVDYLINAEINPEALANFLYKISSIESDIPQFLQWMSTHPESKERATYIIEYIGDRETSKEAILAPKSWEKLKNQLTD